jgi:hypothetical protein
MNRGLPDYLRQRFLPVLPLGDVEIREPMAPLLRGPDYDGALTYIHKVKDDRDIYFFANSSPKSI